jgi:membrane protease YdiL (CAAX protease family)
MRRSSGREDAYGVHPPCIGRGHGEFSGAARRPRTPDAIARDAARDHLQHELDTARRVQAPVPPSAPLPDDVPAGRDGPRRWVVVAWRYLLGDLPETPRTADSAPLILWATTWAALGMWLGLRFSYRGDPLLVGAWRMLVHGGLPLVGLALWELRAAGRARTGSPSGAAVALVGVAGLLASVGARFTVAGEAAQRAAPFLALALPSLVATALVIAGLRLARRDLTVWGIGLGDWRWWLPHHGVLLAGLVPFLMLVTWLVEPLAAFYPTNRAARHDLGAFGWAHLGLALDFIGWEFLFRGYLLFAAARRGDALLAIVLSAIPFFLLHGEKPHVELLSSLVGGFFAGWFCLRARSFFPLWVIHLAMITTVGFTSFLIRNGGRP